MCRLITFTIIFAISINCFAKSSIINKNVERTIDLSSQLVKEYTKIIAESDDGTLFTQYEFVLPLEERKNLAFISAKDADKKNIKIEEKIKKNLVHFTLSLPLRLATQVINIDSVYSRKISPYPVKIRQSEKQFVKYSGPLHFSSPYETKLSKTVFKITTSNIVSHTQIKPFTVSNNLIKYGPFENIEPLSNKTVEIHYENQSPFIAINFVERVIEVSHWGNIAVKENIFLTHTGAELKGSFSRYEFQKDARSSQFAVKSYKTILPSSATGVFYRDSNGNISTSNMNVLREFVELELRPRFPLFGGWKTNYILGYNVPSFEYLYTSNKNYLLKMRVIDHILDDMNVENAVVKIVLPEGSTNIKLSTPYSVKREADKLLHTYLDTIGRPVVSFSKSNLVDNHIADFELKYEFNKISLLIEPLLVISFIYIIFICTILFLRLDFSINSHAHKE